MKTALNVILCCALGTLLLGGVDEVRAATPAYGPMPQAQGLPAWRVSPAIAPPVGAGIINGGFETGNFTGWTVVNQVDGSGDWFVYSGTVSPLSFFTIAAPPEGNFAATSDQTGPGSHILFQDVALAPSQEHALSFILYYENQNGDFFTPASLDYTVFPNQQYRVDVMDPAAPVDSVAPGDVLANLFQTRVGDPASLAPTLMTFSLSAFAGRTVRLRFAEVDNQFFFQGSVDAVAITSASVSQPINTVPTMSPAGFAVVVLAVLIIGTLRLTQHQRRRTG